LFACSRVRVSAAHHAACITVGRHLDGLELPHCGCANGQRTQRRKWKTAKQKAAGMTGAIKSGGMGLWKVRFSQLCALLYAGASYKMRTLLWGSA